MRNTAGERRELHCSSVQMGLKVRENRKHQNMLTQQYSSNNNEYERDAIAERVESTIEISF